MESAYRGEEKIKKDTILKLIKENRSLTVAKRMKAEVGFGKH